jgi:hypothetical protein
MLAGCVALSLVAAASGQRVRFEKIVLTDEYLCDGINAGDFNRDGHVDVVAGPYWYEGPAFTTRHEFYPAVPQDREASPSNSLFSFVHDFDGDGWPDILVLGRVLHHQAFWYRNPGQRGGLWPKHFAIHRVYGESPGFFDIDGDGRPEVLAHWEKRWGWWAPDWSDPTRPWRFHPVTAAGGFKEYYHGQGVGDINGDGRLDLLLNEGWWEQPAQPGRPWVAHPFLFSHDRGGAQMYAYDINGDGRNDVVTARNSHGWGLSWFEQVRAGGGAIGFREHRMMGTREEEAQFGVAFSQPHALDIADFDGDGLPDVLVGKRRWAHGPKGDVEPMGTPVIYWFQARREPGGRVAFRPQLVDDASGTGTQIVAADVNRDGVPDILSASKLGAFVFITRRE